MNLCENGKAIIKLKVFCINKHCALVISKSAEHIVERESIERDNYLTMCFCARLKNTA